jgi:hypothetical protein
MADCVLERIAQNVLTTLQNVTTSNGYDYTISPERLKASTTESHLKAVLAQLPPDESDDAPIGTDQWKQSFSIVVYVMPTEDDTTPIDTYNNAVYAAIYKELMRDYTRGGLALNTIIKPVVHMPPLDGSPPGIVFFFDVIYRHAIDNPF